MKTMMKTAAFCAVLPLLAACATADTAVPRNYYDTYNCQQLQMEHGRLNGRITNLAQSYESQEIMGAMASAFGMDNDFRPGNSRADRSELDRLYKQRDVLEETAIRKSCATPAYR